MRHDLPGIISFQESHTLDVGTTLYLYGLKRGQRVLVVEDEVTTGMTLLGAIRALREAGMVVNEAATVLCVDDPAIDERFADAGVRLRVAARIPTTVRDELFADAAVSGRT